MASWLRERAKGVADNFIAALILAGVIAVISGLTTYSANANDVPLYKAIMLGVAVFLAIALAVFLIVYLVLLVREHFAGPKTDTERVATNPEDTRKVEEL